jgi:hypothetical protein
MGARSLSVIGLVGLAGACGSTHTETTTISNAGPVSETPVQLVEVGPTTLPDRIAWDFEQAVKQSKAAYQDLFDFDAVGEYEILLHRYDVYGRVRLSDKLRAELAAEDGTPYPPAREKTNVGRFYATWVKRTVGSGGCAIGTPRGDYAQKLADIEPLREGTPPKYEVLRAHAAAWVKHGGLVRVHCTGGDGGVALVWTRKDNARGYDLITIYDD